MYFCLHLLLMIVNLPCDLNVRCTPFARFHSLGYLWCRERSAITVEVLMLVLMLVKVLVVMLVALIMHKL